MNQLTKDEAYVVAEFLDASLIQQVRDDTDIDNMKWLCNIVSAYKKLGRYSGYFKSIGVKFEDDE